MATAVGFVPIIGDAIDIIGAAVGQDLLTGESITGIGVAATIGGTILGSGRLGRQGAGVVGRFIDEPGDFRRIGAFTEPDTNRRARGGASIQEIFENAEGDRVIRHTVLDRHGNVIDGPHPRPFFKPRKDELDDVGRD